MENKQLLLKALESLDPAGLTYTEWINVGAALKQEGFDCSVWDEWSSSESRYKPGECQRKWKSFTGKGNPVTGGTIVKMAKDKGFRYYAYEGNGAMEWNDVIFYDGLDYSNEAENTPKLTGPEQLIKYLETLFQPSDYVGYVTNDVWMNEDGKWMPSKGVYHKTAGELISDLKKHSDIADVIGDCKPGCGAWIRFNALDGQGVKNENVTSFKYALVESDEMSIPEQDALYQKLQLPIAALVHSGKKSLHAIVKIDAENYEDYRKRVDYLYDYLEKNGLKVDKQNRNPSRLSRMPGVKRGDAEQSLLATNIGKESWSAWLDFTEGAADDLPKLVALSDFTVMPKLPEELIKGVLRCGHKMLISGSSKAGKSFLLMELSIALAEGKKWLGFQCKPSKVLYVNLEIDPASCINRFDEIYKALKYTPTHKQNIVIWNLRGHAVPLNELVPKLVRRIDKQNFDAVIIDPIYKVITGDENNASEMGAFCNQFDKICNETGCAAIYCHHHSKGAQGMKKSQDRASGSGVFARDPDAALDIIQLETDEGFMLKNADDIDSTAWRLEGSLREFKAFKPVNFWFEYPIHRVDDTGILQGAKADGEILSKADPDDKRQKAKDERREKFDHAFNTVCMGFNYCEAKTLYDYLGVSRSTVYSRVKEYSDMYRAEGEKIYKI